jgi:alkylation response protein AidB-like acyl-CoA dehydrogenase
MRSLMDAELRMLDELALDFAARELAEKKDECDRYPYAPFFEDVLEKALEVGFFSITLPEELDGDAGGMSALSLVLEDICRTDASLAGIIFTNTLAQEIVLSAGAAGALARPAQGNGSYRESLLAFPSYDNPAENLGLSAESRRDGTFALTGVVEFVVLGGVVARALLPAVVGGQAGYSFFLVDLDAGRVGISEPVLSLGLHSCPAADITLSGAAGRLVGEQGAGERYFTGSADRMSIAAAAMSTGIMKGCFDEALDYSRHRFQGGREIVNWSEVRRILADLAVAATVADSLLTQACRSADGDEPGWRLCARAASLHVQALACDATTDGIQLLGGNGYMEDYGQEKRFRDAKQVQALLGIAPVRKLDYLDRLADGELAY